MSRSAYVALAIAATLAFPTMVARAEDTSIPSSALPIPEIGSSAYWRLLRKQTKEGAAPSTVNQYPSLAPAASQTLWMRPESTKQKPTVSIKTIAPIDAATVERTEQTATANAKPVTKTEPAAANAAQTVPATEQTATMPTETRPAVSTDSRPFTTKQHDGAQIAAVAPSPAKTLASPEHALEGLIVIDNDEAKEQEISVQFENLPTDETHTKVKVGAKFPIIVVSQISSKTAKEGDPVQGRTKYDIKIGDRLIAKKGSIVRGHVNYALRARTQMGSLLSTTRWYRNSGCVGVCFDEVINENGEHIPIVAEPSRQALYVKNKAQGRVLGINHKGQITGPWSQQLEYKAIRIGLNAAFSATGAFSFGAMPVALGVIGAVNPSFAFMKPIGTNVRHRRIKGFFWGALSGLPGSWLIEDTTIKGQEAVIEPGDEFLAEVRQEWTGEPSSDAELSGADKHVQGEVVRHGKKKRS